jgi:hypothetical protein
MCPPQKKNRVRLYAPVTIAKMFAIVTTTISITMFTIATTQQVHVHHVAYYRLHETKRRGF